LVRWLSFVEKGAGRGGGFVFSGRSWFFLLPLGVVFSGEGGGWLAQAVVAGYCQVCFSFSLVWLVYCKKRTFAALRVETKVGILRLGGAREAAR
jgi:hypothetical protein